MADNDKIELRDVPDQQNPDPDPALFVANGVTFDGLHSYTDFGLWLVARPDTGSPKPKLNQVEVPGMDGTLDMTEANAGEVKFTNRTMVFRFAGKVGISEQAEFKANIMNALHGKRIERIILDEDQLWFYTGRVSVQFPQANPWKIYCTITVDAEPYAQRVWLSSVSLDPNIYGHDIQPIRIGEKDTATSIAYISDYKLGTKEFPDGLPVDLGFDRISIKWNENVQWSSPSKVVSVWDADGGFYRGIYTPNETDYGFVVLYSDIEDAGVNLSRVYRVCVNNIGYCWITVNRVFAYAPIQNSRRNVVPTFVLDALAPAKFMFNGIIYTIHTRGPYVNPNIVLHSGLNEFYLPLDGPQSLEMTFREGKL